MDLISKAYPPVVPCVDTTIEVVGRAVTGRKLSFWLSEGLLAMPVHISLQLLTLCVISFLGPIYDWHPIHVGHWQKNVAYQLTWPPAFTCVVFVFSASALLQGDIWTGLPAT